MLARYQAGNVRGSHVIERIRWPERRRNPGRRAAESKSRRTGAYLRRGRGPRSRRERPHEPHTTYARGNQTKAAAILGISRKALWEKRKRFGLR